MHMSEIKIINKIETILKIIHHLYEYLLKTNLKN